MAAAYGPSQLDVLPGENVLWTNVSQRTHTVTSDTGLFDSGHVLAAGHFEFRFNQAGTFNFGTNGTTVTGTQVSNFQLISQGSAPNQRVQFIFHATIDSNGNVAVSFSDFKTVCQ